MRLLQPLHVHLSTLFFTLTLLVGCLIGGLGYYMSASMVQTAASEQWERMGQSVQQELRNTLEPAEMALQFLRVHRITLADSLPQRLDSLSVMSQVLKGASVISAVYVGYPNGDFFLLRRLDESDHALLDAPPAARFVVQSIAHGIEPAGYYIYLGAQGEIIQRTERQGYGNAYDPAHPRLVAAGPVCQRRGANPPLCVLHHALGGHHARGCGAGRGRRGGRRYQPGYAGRLPSAPQSHAQYRTGLGEWRGRTGGP